MPQLPSAIAGMPYRGARPYTRPEAYQLFSQGTGAYNQPGFGPTSGAQMPVAGQPFGVVTGGQRAPGAMPPQQTYPQQTQMPNWNMSQFQGTPSQSAGLPQQPPLRVSQPPSTAQHLSDLLSQRNQATALELNRGASLANAQHGLAAQKARAGAGLGWAGIHSSEQLAGIQNQFDVINAIIRLLNDPLSSALGGF